LHPPDLKALPRNGSPQLVVRLAQSDISDFQNPRWASSIQTTISILRKPQLWLEIQELARNWHPPVSHLGRLYGVNRELCWGDDECRVFVTASPLAARRKSHRMRKELISQVKRDPQHLIEERII
jgi:hypothetical protein